MAHPFLKSVRPVNLLSFGPNTEDIELRPLNILIGPNGSGKSNLIEIIGLLSNLTDKDPWSTLIETGGAREWIWKGRGREEKLPSLSVVTSEELVNVGRVLADPRYSGEGPLLYFVTFREFAGAFEVVTERFQEIETSGEGGAADSRKIEREPKTIFTNFAIELDEDSERIPKQPPGRSVLSAPYLHHTPSRIREFAEAIQRFAFYRDWVFGLGSKVREPQPAGLDSYSLEKDSRNLAQVLKAWRDRGDQAVYDRLVDLLRKFYEPVKDVDTELLGTHLRIMIRESTGFNTPASRLSDGTLHWLTLLIILLNPTPPPLICIDEPELGLHPDILPTLADLLVDASTRTQLIVTTHSRSLLDSFTEMPEAVCVCEKVDGSTVIQRLDKDQLKVWLDKYALGKLWTAGEIGGNRW